jgi:hypothetical protein
MLTPPPPNPPLPFPTNRINNFTTMAPGQVQLSAFANVTLSLSLNDLPPATTANTAQLTAAVTAAASQWAVGFDPAYIVVSLEKPEYGVLTPQFQAAGVQQVVQRDQDTLILPSSSSSSGGSRRLLQQRRLRRLGSRRSMLAAAPPAATAAATAAVARRSMLAAAAPAAAGGGLRGSGSGVRVWVTYARMIPLNATAVQRRFAASCGVEGLTAGLMLDGTPCAEVLAQAMRTVGLAVPTGGVGLEMVDAPMVSQRGKGGCQWQARGGGGEPAAVVCSELWSGGFDGRAYVASHTLC